MSVVRDRDEVEAVLQAAIGRTSLEELLEPLAPTCEAVDLLLHSGLDEEVGVELVNGECTVIATLYVDIMEDPLNEWTIKLRGWRLAGDVASV